MLLIWLVPVFAAVMAGYYVYDVFARSRAADHDDI